MYPSLSTIDMAAVYQRDLLTTAGVASPSSRENNDARGRATFCQSNSSGDTRPRGSGRVPAARARDLVLLVTLVALVLAALGAGLIPVAPRVTSDDAGAVSRLQGTPGQGGAVAGTYPQRRGLR
jgi:hypothetical protein